MREALRRYLAYSYRDLAKPISAFADVSGIPAGQTLRSAYIARWAPDSTPWEGAAANNG